MDVVQIENTATSAIPEMCSRAAAIPVERVPQWGSPQDRASNSLAHSSGKQKAGSGGSTTKMQAGSPDGDNKADPQAIADLYEQQRVVATKSSAAGHAGLVRQALAVAGMSFGCVLDGTVIAYSSPALPSLFKPDSSLQINIHWASWIGSVHTLGAVLGCLVSIPTMALLGRRGAALYVMTLAYLLGYLLIGCAQNVEMIVVGRVFGGIGLGLTLSITPVYLVEISTLQYRGMLGVLPPLLTQVGLLVTYVSGIWLEWGPLALSGLALVLPNLAFIWAIPESPAFLASRGNYAATETALRRLGRPEDPATYFKQIQSEMELERQHSVINASGGGSVKHLRGRVASFMKTYTHPSVWRPTAVCFAIMFFFQATGYNTVVAYSKLIFKESGLAIDDDLAVGVTGGVILVSCAAAIGLSRVTPRKGLLLASSFGSCGALLTLGAYYYIKKTEGGGLAAHAWVPLAAMLGLIVSFMIGFGAVAWTVMAELLPAHLRSRIYPFAVAFAWVCNFVFALSFGYIQKLLGSYASFWTYAGLSFAGGLFIAFLVPETKDRTAEEVAAFFESRQQRRWFFASSSAVAAAAAEKKKRRPTCHVEISTIA